MLGQNNKMRVQKRNGDFQPVSFDKIIWRMENLSKGLNIDAVTVAQKVIVQLHDKIKTSQLDELAAEICVSLATENLDYGKLASMVIISNNHKNTSPSFSEAMTTLYNNRDANGNHLPVISKSLYDVVMANRTKLNSVINYERDFDFSYFGYKTLERAYLLRTYNKRIIERIQHLIMRVCLGIHGQDIKSAINSYELMSQKYFTHATPTLFNSGTTKNQLASCFLLGTDDSIEGMYETIKHCALISKSAGGIGLHMTNIRSKGSYVNGTNGVTNGIVPYARVVNDTMKHVDQGGRRPGSTAFYIEPHHPEIMAFLDLKKNHGNEELRARDLFLAMWISDLFMERVKANTDWSTFDDNLCPGLRDAYGDEYKELYLKYESEGKSVKNYKARDVWDAILTSLNETGTPYMAFKDNVNRKSNQANVGTIKSSNLCVSGDTKILTSKGYYNIKSLENKEVEVWNGEEFSTTIVKKTGENQEMMKIKFSNGSELKCTPYHKFYISHPVLNYKIMRANQLKIGMKIIKYKIPNMYDNGFQTFNITITGTEFLEEKMDTFCFTERKLGRGIFNGILTGQCAEIMEYSDTEEYAVCTLASVGLPKFVEDGVFNYDKLIEVMEVLVKNLDTVIDINFYPVEQTRVSNERHRPMGIGVQGLADVFALMKVPFDSDEARVINKNIFETMYYGALVASNKLAKEKGTYSSFRGSPISEGKFQFDLAGVKPSDRYDWDALRADIMENGVRNSLLIALMPTASTSQILGNNECFEPYTSNIYTRSTIAGDFVVINEHMVRDLDKLGLWNAEMKDKVIFYNGSIQHIEEIPQNIKDLYRTAWEIKQKVIIDMAADRQPFVDQSQSMNLFFEEPKDKELTGAFFYGHKRGLKTGSYYLRTRPKVQAQQFTIDPEKFKRKVEENKKLNEEKYEVCEMCSS
jgi:ribonucleotide reductase alpha subunit